SNLVIAMKQNHALRLFVISWLILFAEVMAIRWMGSEVVVLRIFPNLTLMTIFIGVSIGLATYKRPLVPLSTMAVAVFGIVGLLLVSTPLELRRLNFADSLFQIVLMLAFLVFNLTVVFVSLGRAMGQEFAELPALKAYSVNLLGSLAGVVCFAFISW